MHELVIFGVTGRMGQSLLRALEGHAELRLCGAVASPESPSLGQAIGADGLRVSSDAALALRGASVALDFSLPQAVADHASACVSLGIPLLVGATGMDAATLALLQGAAERIPVLVAPNTSVGVNVVAKLAGLAAKALGAGYDVEISEAHHRMKRDAPSGTALALGAAVAQARGATQGDTGQFVRHGELGPRPPGAIGFAVVRAGDIVGEHTVLFAGEGERVEITHRATDRQTFALGALRGAQWLIGRSPGYYRMADVLGL
jgi:4-hydroxy-tetrahydrodipicolinate reductase